MQVGVTSFQGRSVDHACGQLKLQVQPRGEEMIWVSVSVKDGRWRRGAEVDGRSRLMMGFGVEGATCKSPASICVMGPSFFARQAPAESHCLLTSGRLHLENDPQQQ